MNMKMDNGDGDINDFFKFSKYNRTKSKMIVDGFLYVDTEDFDDYGGWRGYAVCPPHGIGISDGYGCWKNRC